MKKLSLTLEKSIVEMFFNKFYFYICRRQLFPSSDKISWEYTTGQLIYMHKNKLIIVKEYHSSIKQLLE
jgi:hypothetical protein